MPNLNKSKLIKHHFGILSRIFGSMCSCVRRFALKLRQPHLKSKILYQSTTTIYDLNDHVLREIFGYLNVLDMCSVANVSMNFKQNAQAVASTRYKSVRFGINIRSKSAKCRLGGSGGSPEHLFSIMRNFGESLQDVSINLDESAHGHSQEILELIGEHCDESMKEIWLRNFILTDALIPKIRPLLAGLQNISLDRCLCQPGFNGSEMMSFCSDLKSLRFRHLKDLNGEYADLRFHARIPTLHSLHLEYCKGIRKGSVVKFLKANPQLKTLNINGCKKITSRIIPSIVQHIPRVEELVFIQNVFTDDFYANTEHLMQLTALKRLAIGGGSAISPIPISSFISKLVAARCPLESLSLWNVASDVELISRTIELKTLKTLKLIHPSHISKSDIITIISNLPELTELWLFVEGIEAPDLVEIIQCASKLHDLRMFHPAAGPPVTYDAHLYMRIVDAVAAREEGGCLNLILVRFPGAPIPTIDVPKGLLKANQGSLRIIDYIMD